MQDLYYLYDATYASSNGVKLWKKGQELREFLVILCVITLMLIGGIFASVLLYKYNLDWIASPVFITLMMLVCILYTRRIAIHHDIGQTAFAYKDGYFWFIKLTHNSSPFGESVNAANMEQRKSKKSSYVMALQEALQGYQFTRVGRQIIHSGPSGQAEVIRLDNLKIIKKTNTYAIIEYLDCKNKTRKKKVMKAFPELFEDIKTMQQSKYHDIKFPQKYNTNNILTYGIFVLVLIPWIMSFGNMTSSLKQNELSEMSYTDFVTDEMYNAVLCGDSFVYDSSDIAYSDGSIEVTIRGTNEIMDLGAVFIYYINEDDPTIWEGTYHVIDRTRPTGNQVVYRRYASSSDLDNN